MLGEEDINTGRRNKIINGDTYTDKVMTKAIYNVNKDKNRWVYLEISQEC